MDTPHFTELPIEFYNEVNDDTNVQVEVEERVRKLAEGHTDIAGGLVTIRREAQNRNNEVTANVTLYSSPDYVSGHATAREVHDAVKGALEHAERQVREKRAKLRGY